MRGQKGTITAILHIVHSAMLYSSLGRFLSRSCGYEPHSLTWGQCMSPGGQKRAAIHWTDHIKLQHKWEHRVNSSHNWVTTVRVWILVTRPRQRRGMCVSECWQECSVSRLFFLVRSYRGRRVAKERRCTAGAVAWRWAGRRSTKGKPSSSISPDCLPVPRGVSSPGARPMTAWLLVIPVWRKREDRRQVAVNDRQYRVDITGGISLSIGFSY